ncbi:MAG: NitT/TauT family transport system substrate-binding protein [Gammaproteobacteria bacterium]|jgi:NitT/TauT family transport system substrate-binding protein
MMQIRLAIPDLVSNSYFPALAAVHLGHFEKQGLHVRIEHIFPVPACFEALRDGVVEMVATSAHGPLWAFPRWQGSKILCSLSQGMYWFLVVRADLPVGKGETQGLAGLTLAAAPGVETGLRQLLAHAGVDPEQCGIEIGLPPGGIPPGTSFGVAAADALRRAEIDGFWANGMAAEVALESGAAKCVLDVRRGDGPPAAFHFTQPALMTSDAFVEEHPEAAGAAVRAIVSAHAALKADPSLANTVAEQLFPAREASLIERLVTRDLPFYDAAVYPELIEGMNEFARGAGLLEGPPVAMHDIVAVQYRALWR